MSTLVFFFESNTDPSHLPKSFNTHTSMDTFQQSQSDSVLNTDTNLDETTMISQDDLSDAESTTSKSSNSSDDANASSKKKIKIKTKKTSGSSSDDEVSESGEKEKKARKPRTTKPNELEKYGFNPELTWNHPKMKKYLDEKTRSPTCLCTIKAHMTGSDDQQIGYLISFRKGAKEESIRFITKFEPEWLNDSGFNNYISTFSGKSSKSSRLVIIHSSAKAWGAKKVESANTSINELMAAIKLSQLPTSEHTVNFSGSQPTTQKELHEAPVLQAPSQSKTDLIKTLPQNVDFNQEFAALLNTFQEQMATAHRDYQENLAKLMLSVSHSTSC